MSHQDSLILAQTEPETSFTFNLHFAEGQASALWALACIPLVLAFFAAYLKSLSKG